MSEGAGRSPFRLLPVLVRAVLVAVALFCIFPSVASAADAPRTRQDVRIDRLSPVALTSATSSALVDPNRQREAATLAGYARPLFLLRSAAEILTLFLLWQTGLAAVMRDALRRYFRYAAPVRLAFGGAIALAALGAGFPFALWGHRLARIALLTPERISSWSEGYLAESLLIAAGVGAIAALVLPLVDKVRTWYLVVAAGVVAFTVGYAAVLPALEDAFNSPTVLAAPVAAAAGVPGVLRRAGMPDMRIVVERTSGRTNEPNAHVEGIGPWRRIALDDTLLATATPGEIAFAVAHELGHADRHDDLRIALALALLVIGSATLAVTVTDRIGFRRDDDPLVRLTLVAAFIGIAYLALLPGYNAYLRALESHADRYAVALTADRASGVRWFVRYVDDELQPLCPPRLVRLYLYDHEAYGTRISELQGKPSPCK